MKVDYLKIYIRQFRDWSYDYFLSKHDGRSANSTKRSTKFEIPVETQENIS